MIAQLSIVSSGLTQYDQIPAKEKKSAYKPEYVEQARQLCLLGATDKQLAEFFNVSTVTLNKWKKDYPEFLYSLKEAKKETQTPKPWR